VAHSGWYLLRAYSDRAELPVLDRYPFAATSPIYVQVGDQLVRSAADAEFFARWIGRLEAAARAATAWNTGAEREEVLRQFGEARAIFEARAR